MCAGRNIEGRPCNRRCSGKTVCCLFWVCVCSLSSPACKVCVPYYVYHHL